MSYLRGPIYWFGGKGAMLSKIVPILEAIPHKRYCEPFGGGGWVLIAKRPVEVETYNDIDHGLVNLFRVLASEEMFEKFYRRVALLPYSRELFYEYRQTWEAQADPVERAARWFYVASQSFAGDFGQSWGSVVSASTRSMATTTSNWLSRLDRLPKIHARLARVQIECADWRVVLERYDTHETLFYLDPPYIPETRKSGRYNHELSIDDHKCLVERLLSLRGVAALSGYKHEVYQPLDQAGWRRLEWQVSCYAAARTRETGIQGEGAGFRMQPRTECLWLSPRAAELCAKAESSALK